MKLTGLHLENWLCHRRLDLAITPLTMICGPNARGKSGAGDAIAFAMLAELRRIKAKGDRAKLITRGADRGSVRLAFGDIEIVRDIETGKLTKSARMPTQAESVDLLPNVLDITLFARMPVDARRVALLRMMSVQIGTAAIHAELVARKRDVKLLGASFQHGVPIEKWHEEATKKATEARGAWKQITGATYGCKKAEDWQAAAPEHAWSLEYFSAAKARKAQAEVEISVLQRTLGRLDSLDHGAAPNLVARRQVIEAQAATLPTAREALATRRQEAAGLQAALAAADKTLADVRARQPGAEPDLCPHCGEGIAQRDGVLVRHVAVANPATPAELATAQEARRALALRVQSANALVLTAEGDEERAQGATNTLAILDTGIAGPASHDMPAEPLPARAQVEADIETHTAARVAAEAEMAALERAREATAAADKATRQAAEKHAQIAAWTLIVEDLSPAGILQTLIGRALDPLNDRLRDLSAHFKWPQARIGLDMEIAIAGTDYELHSESEKWRADASLAIAIAAITQLRIVVLDRFDVLEIPARQAALGALYALTRPGKLLDTCIIMATLKAPPMVPADVSLAWLGEPVALQVAA